MASVNEQRNTQAQDSMQTQGSRRKLDSLLLLRQCRKVVANVDGPGFISSRFVSSDTATFLEKNIGQDLEQLNSRTVADIQNGSLTGPNLDARLVHTEQTEVQKQLKRLNKSDPTAYAKTISEINGVLNPSGVGA